MNAPGALAGMVAGGGTVLIWGSLSGGIFELYELVPGFVLAGIASILVSLSGIDPFTITEGRDSDATGTTR